MRVAEKSNEIPALPVRLDSLDLRGQRVAAAQVLELRRLVVERGQKKKSPPLLLLTSAPPARWHARALLKARRDYWGTESTFHQRLDETLDEDRSRVRPPNAAHALGLFRRLIVSVGHAWLKRAQKKNARASLRTLVTAKRPETRAKRIAEIALIVRS